MCVWVVSFCCLLWVFRLKCFLFFYCTILYFLKSRNWDRLVATESILWSENSHRRRVTRSLYVRHIKVCLGCFYFIRAYVFILVLLRDIVEIPMLTETIWDKITKLLHHFTGIGVFLDVEIYTFRRDGKTFPTFGMGSLNLKSNYGKAFLGIRENFFESELHTLVI